jgi:hypothetical protein
MVSDAHQGGGSITLTYDGLTNQVASDSSASYSRDPAGRITGSARPRAAGCSR